jgi:hypothetical protein
VYLVLPPGAKAEDWNSLVVQSRTAASSATQVQVLQPSYDQPSYGYNYYGPITNILAVWEEEQRLHHQDTRILYWKDSSHPQFFEGGGLLQSLVEASRQYPDAVVATSGVAHFRNHFRQVTWDAKKDKFPNLWLQQQHKQQQQAEIVTGAVCLPVGLIDLTPLPQLVRDAPAVTRPSEEIFMSALMEAQNITRWIVPSTTSTTTSANATSLETWVDAKQWMKMTYHLQHTLDIWKEYQFLNPSKLTPAQWEAINCEAAHEQDCTTSDNDNGVCLPNPQKCPQAQKILQTLSSP